MNKDSENCEICFKLLLDLVKRTPEIELRIWFSAMMKVMALSWLQSGCSYQEYLKDMQKSNEFYKSIWDIEDVD